MAAKVEDGSWYGIDRAYLGKGGCLGAQQRLPLRLYRFIYLKRMTAVKREIPRC